MLKKLSYHTSTPPFEIIKRMNVIPLTFTKIIPNSANPLKYLIFQFFFVPISVLLNHLITFI